MPSSSYPKSVSEVISMLGEIFRHQERLDLAEVCESSNARIEFGEYDNWNGGTNTWVLNLEIPTALYVRIKSRLKMIEQEIGAELTVLNKRYPNDVLGNVQIYPVENRALSAWQRMSPAEVDVKRLWGASKFRLFLSHLSADKVLVSSLKSELAMRGVSAFVAHDDIEPSLKWKGEIECALRSMHALATILTPNFHASKWTDQEIGWALGRGVLVLPIRMGLDPYGFFGDNQGIPGGNKSAAALASEVVRALLVNPQTHGEMKQSVVRSFQSASTWDEAKSLRGVILQIDDFSEEEASVLIRACDDNPEVKQAFGVPEAIKRKFNRT